MADHADHVLPSAMPVLRRSTHSYCVDCRVSKQEYNETVCSLCGCTTFTTCVNDIIEATTNNDQPIER